jgi:Xaa-Pro aminopeptidase
MDKSRHRERVERCAALMKASGLDALLLTKPANMFYLTGDGRLCAYAMITQNGRVALGVPMTDVEDVRALARFDHIAGFENEVGMIHSIAHHFKEFGIQRGTVGLEFTFLTQAMMGMVTHPHAKPKEVAVKDCTHILSELRIVKDSDEIKRIRNAASVADLGMRAAMGAVREGVEETEVAADAEHAMRSVARKDFPVPMSPLDHAPISPTDCRAGANLRQTIWS